MHHLSAHSSSNYLTCVFHISSLFLISVHIILLNFLFPFIPSLSSDHINIIMCLLDDPEIVDNCSYISYEKLCSTDHTNDSLSILQLNMRGLINKQSDLNKLLHAGSTNKVDVALLCETWLRQDTVKFIDIPQYTLISKERKAKKGGGVCILTRDSLKIR